MFEYFEQKLNGGKKVTKTQSFFVGVHAGRKSRDGVTISHPFEKDCYDHDQKFAEAVGLKFYTPEEYFEV
jgi:bifunctional polynucleotide phosphatase/kinase